MIDVIKVVKKMKHGTIDNVYILQGTEQYFIEQFKNGLENLLKEEVNDEVFSYDLREIPVQDRSEEHTSELQSRGHLVCRLLLEKKNVKTKYKNTSINNYY